MERGTSRTITYIGFLLAVILVLGAAFVAYRSQKLYHQTVTAEAHTYIVLEAATDFLNRMLQGESSARGYALTGDRALRLDSDNSLTRAWPLLDSLLSLTLDDPVQQQHLARIGPLATRRVALIQETLAARDSAGGVTAQISAIVHSGDAVMHQIRKELVEFKIEELGYLDAQTSTAEETGARALTTAAIGIGLALLILLAAISITFKELRERERAEGDLVHEGERQAVMIEMQQAIATAAVGDQMVLELIVAQAMQLTGADGAMLAVVDPDGDHYTVRNSLGNVAQWRGQRMDLHTSIIGWVTRHREATMIPDAYADHRVDQKLVRTLTNRSLVVLPILEGERAIGALLIASMPPDAFTQREFTVLKIMGGILSAGLTNAAAYEANERLLAELRQSRDAAEDANKAKSSFLATMSHELRTPLNSVIGFANLLIRNRAGNLTAQDLQYLGRISDNGTHLLHLINDVLDVSKIEAGRMEVHPVPTDLAPLVRDTIAQLGGQATSRAVDLRAEAADGLLPVEVDPARLKQVLINLIGNALKFTEQGSVTVKVVADIGGRPLRIDVIDTGIGIAPDRLEAVFEAFTQAEATTERRFGGSGLGLTISRSLLRLMGADLTARSTPGLGSTFSITFPASAARVAADLVSRELRPAPGSRTGMPPLILIVDDEADARTLLRSYLTDDGYRTAEAVNGADGLAHARTLHPALITLDLRMPGLNGIEFLRQLRADPSISHIPVLVISIEAGEHAGSLIGAMDVLAKPVERDELLGVVQRILPVGSRRVLVVDDDVHTRQLFAAVLGAEGYQVRTARDGLEAFSALESEVPDLVLLDLMMPVMDGGTFLAALRRNPRYSSLPVAVVTALDTDSEAVRRLDGAAQAVVQKGPALEQTLRDVLQKVLGT